MQLTKFHLILTLPPPCSASFNFACTNPDDIMKIIRYLRPKSSAGHDNISTKLLKENEHITSCPLSIIINQSPCTCIFPDKIKIAKLIPLKMIINHLEITVQYHYFLLYQKSSNGLCLTNYTITSHLMAYCTKANTDSANITPLN